MLPTFIFDIGGVYFTDGTKSAIEKISSLYNIDKRLVSEVFCGKIGLDYRKRNITFGEFSEKANEYWQSSDISADSLWEIWISGYKPIDGTIRIIKNLRELEYEVFYLSGNAPDRVEYLNRKYDFLNNFNGGMFSHNVGFSKNDPSLYESFIKKIGCDPYNCIAIDDKPECLSLAAQTGMKIIHFTTPEILRLELIKLKLI
jgi:HAD superfamily hydrolase (TIGR01509 family)